MNISKSNLYLSLITSGMFAILLGYYLTLHGFDLLPTAVLGIGAGISVCAAIYLPLATVITLFVTGILPDIFMMTPIYSEDYGALGKGLFAVDIVMILMGIAVAINILRKKIDYKNRFELYENKLGIRWYVIVFFLLILFEIIRNLGNYGLSAPGEFRYRYLILVVPLYVSVFFPSKKERIKLLKLLIFLSVFVTLGCIPFIGILKGWHFGEGDRFVPASVSLGMVYGLISLLIGKKYRLLSLNILFAWIMTTAVLIMVLIDSHRSVWLTTGVILLALVWLREIELLKFWAWGIAIIITLSVVWLVISQTEISILEYIMTRRISFINPEKDPTSAWRLALWSAQLEKVFASPILGEGFGGYWEVYVPEFGGKINISPHNLYIQTLVKMGVLGLVIYLAIVFQSVVKLMSWIRYNKKATRESAIVITALVILIGAHAFYFVYAFEYYTWLFVGLGIATIRDYRSRVIRK